jgi:hypothetical protein
LELQAVKLRLVSGNYFSILNLYNPNAAVTLQEFTHYTNQLTSPFILTGDFNAHSPLLYSTCPRPNFTGHSLEQLLLTTNLTLLNGIDFHTYIDRRTGRGSCLDLFLISSDVSPYFHLDRLRDVGSDHYPISASSVIPLHLLSSVPVPRWKITDENLRVLSGSVAASSLVHPISVEEFSADVTSRIIRTASACIPQSSGRRSERLTSPWWDEACGEAVRNRRRARRALEKHPTQANLIEYKRCQAIARNCVLKRKGSYQREFLSKITYTTPIGVAWRKVRLLRSRCIMPAYPLMDDGNLLHTTLAKANLFCQTFQECGQSGQIRAPSNLHNLIIGSWAECGECDSPFTKDELSRAVRCMRTLKDHYIKHIKMHSYSEQRYDKIRST